MKKAFFVLFILVLLSAAWTVSGQKALAVSSPSSLGPDPDFGRLPLYFAPNRGQADPEALFYARTSLYTLLATREGLVLDSRHEENEDVSRLVFAGANPDVRVYAEQPTEHRVSYFLGDDPSHWRAGIPTSRAIVYEGVYRGIDLKVYGCEREIEYDWIVKPGGDPRDIKLVLEAVCAVSLDDKGDLVTLGSFGEIRHKKPVAYQTVDGERRPVTAAFVIFENKAFGIRVGRYNPAFDLVIDPMVIVYATYLGGNGNETGYSIDVDSSGAVYLIGTTASAGFPLKKAYQPKIAGSRDIFVTKIAPGGKSLVYSTFLGGTKADGGMDIEVDADGAAVIAGYTESGDFPVFNAWQKTNRGFKEAILVKLAADGQSLEYSTYLGGSKIDWCYDLALADDGTVYLSGYTFSTNFPVKKALQSSMAGRADAFLTKFSKTGQSLIFSTYLGGSDIDNGWGLAVDKDGSAYLGGETESLDFPVKNAFQSRHGGGGRDLFVTKVSADGQTMVYSTYLGGAQGDSCYGLAVDGQGQAVIVGSTASENFPTKSPFQSSLKKGRDAFVTKFSSSGRSLVFSSYLGGSGSDEVRGVASDSEGRTYLCGLTGSSDFPVKNAFQKTYGKGTYDAFVSEIAADGTKLEFSSFLGGTSDDFAQGLAVGSDGAIYVAGDTESKDFPVKNAFKSLKKGGTDAFVVKVSKSASGSHRATPDKR